MNAGLDTSFVLRLLTGEPEQQAALALAEMQNRIAEGSTLLVSDLVVAEVYFALQHHYGLPKTEALSLLTDFLHEQGITSTGNARAVLATPKLATVKPGFVDRMIHAAYHQLAADMLTFEKAAARLPGVRVLDAASID